MDNHKFSRITRAILASIEHRYLTTAEICQATRLDPKDVYARVANGVRRGYITSRPGARCNSPKSYLAAAKPDAVQPFKSEGPFDFSALLQCIGPSADRLPHGNVRTILRNEEDADAYE